MNERVLGHILPEREKAMLEAKKAGTSIPQGKVVHKPW
jgi:hypothetical protein